MASITSSHRRDSEVGTGVARTVPNSPSMEMSAPVCLSSSALKARQYSARAVSYCWEANSVPKREEVYIRFSALCRPRATAALSPMAEAKVSSPAAPHKRISSPPSDHASNSASMSAGMSMRCTGRMSVAKKLSSVCSSQFTAHRGTGGSKSPVSSINCENPSGSRIFCNSGISCSSSFSKADHVGMTGLHFLSCKKRARTA